MWLWTHYKSNKKLEDIWLSDSAPYSHVFRDFITLEYNLPMCDTVLCIKHIIKVEAIIDSTYLSNRHRIVLNALNPNYGSNNHFPFSFGDDIVSQPALKYVNKGVSNVGLRIV